MNIQSNDLSVAEVAGPLIALPYSPGDIAQLCATFEKKRDLVSLFFIHAKRIKFFHANGIYKCPFLHTHWDTFILSVGLICLLFNW